MVHLVAHIFHHPSRLFFLITGCRIDDQIKFTCARDLLVRVQHAKRGLYQRTGLCRHKISAYLVIMIRTVA